MYLLLIYFLILVVPFLVMPKYIKNRTMSPYRTVLQSVLFIAAAVVVVFMVASITGEGLFAQLQGPIKSVAKELAGNTMLMERFDIASLSEGERVELFEQLYQSVFALIPACVLIVGAVASYIEYILLAYFIGKKRPVDKMPPFREFSFSNGAITGIVSMYLIAWVLTKTEVFRDGMMYANMNCLFDFAFSIQGISVVLMFCHMKKIPKAIAVIGSAILWLNAIGRLVLILIGMFDLIFNFKEMIQSKSARR